MISSPRFADGRTRLLFVRHVEQQSNGVPAVVLGTIDSARSEDQITPAKVRGGARMMRECVIYMTPMLVIVLVVAMAARYIGRGIGEMELVVLSESVQRC